MTTNGKTRIKDTSKELFTILRAPHCWRFLRVQSTVIFIYYAYNFDLINVQRHYTRKTESYSFCLLLNCEALCLCIHFGKFTQWTQQNYRKLYNNDWKMHVWKCHICMPTSSSISVPIYFSLFFCVLDMIFLDTNQLTS